MYTIEFYATEDGKKPAKDFIFTLNEKMQAASQKMYAAGAQPGAQPGADPNMGGAGFQGGQQAGPSSQNTQDVQDADFEEVK